MRLSENRNSDVDLSASPDQIQQTIVELTMEINLHQEIIDQDNVTREEFKIENARRKHNYIPFILELLKISAENGQLEQQYEKARQSTTQAK